MDKVLENLEQEEVKQGNQPINRDEMMDEINEQYKEVLFYYQDCVKD